MAVLVEAQGEILDNIENQVRLYTFCMLECVLMCSARMLCIAWCCVLMGIVFRLQMQLIMSKEGTVHFKMQRNSRRTPENGCALLLLFSY